MIKIWKHFLVNRRPGLLPAVIAVALISLGVFLMSFSASPPFIIFGVAIWAYCWLIVVPAAVYHKDHPNQHRRIPPGQLN